MDVTLERELRELEGVKKDGSDLGIKLMDQQYDNARARIFNQFYAQNPEAIPISLGNDLYSRQIDKIDRMYNRGRTLAPGVDSDFDEGVTELVGSLKEIIETDLTAETFITGGRNVKSICVPIMRGSYLVNVRSIKNHSVLALGAFLTAAYLTGAYLLSKGEFNTAHIVVDAVIASIAVAGHLDFKKKERGTLTKALQELREVATSADQLLQENPYQPI